MNSFWKRFIIKKAIIIGLLVIASIGFGVISSFANIPATQVSAEAGLEMARGRDSVSAMATYEAAGSFLAIGRVVSQTIMFILIFAFLWDTSTDIAKLAGFRRSSEDRT